jgi:Flp pilus assembly pilin Flp
MIRSMVFNGNKGSTMLEYAVLAVALVLALLVMQVPLRRAISYKWREAADSFGSGRQYEQGVTTVTSN